MKATFAHAVAAEWTKLRTLRSTTYTLVFTMALGVGLGFLFCAGAATAYPTVSPAEQASFDPGATSLQGYLFAQLSIGVLGVLVVSGEYATRMILPSLTAVPQRIRLLAAKALVFGAVALGAGLLIGVAAFLVGQVHLREQGVAYATLSQPGVARAVIGFGLYLAAIGLAGVALGVLLRATAGALAVLIAITVVIPVLVTVLPDDWEAPILRWWPTTAGAQVMAVVRDPAVLGPWAGYGVLLAFVVGLVGVAAVVLRRRDA